jgi:hypothetical protein
MTMPELALLIRLGWISTGPLKSTEKLRKNGSVGLDEIGKAVILL